MAYTKGSSPVTAKYASGGPVITTRSRFLKTPNQFTATDENADAVTMQDYTKKGKGGELSKTEGESKKQPTIKPRT